MFLDEYGKVLLSGCDHDHSEKPVFGDFFTNGLGYGKSEVTV
jgi:hypothetical protein